jgi:hypothetical protein
MASPHVGLYIYIYHDINFIQNCVPSMKYHSLNLSQIIDEKYLCQFLWQLTEIGHHDFGDKISTTFITIQ